MVWEQDVPQVFTIKLSTGYELAVDLTKTTKSWLPHLARTIVGERFFKDSKASKRWLPEVVSEEVRFLLVTMPSAQKDLLLGQVIYERVMQLYRKLEKRANEKINDR